MGISREENGSGKILLRSFKVPPGDVAKDQKTTTTSCDHELRSLADYYRIMQSGIRVHCIPTTNLPMEAISFPTI